MSTNETSSDLKKVMKNFSKENLKERPYNIKSMTGNNTDSTRNEGENNKGNSNGN